MNALSRLEDVDPNQVRLEERSGSILFQARRGRSLDPGAIRTALQGTELFPRRGLRVNYLELTVAGQVTLSAAEVRLQVARTKQRFVLAPMRGAGPAAVSFRRLREALARGEKVAGVTGRVEGWSGSALPAASPQDTASGDVPKPVRPPRLLVTGFTVAPKQRRERP